MHAGPCEVATNGGATVPGTGPPRPERDHRGQAWWRDLRHGHRHGWHRDRHGCRRRDHPAEGADWRADAPPRGDRGLDD